jgi:hypothetical protein
MQKLLEKEGLFCNHAFPWHFPSALICDPLLTPKNIFEVLSTSFKEIISQRYGDLE